MRRMANPRPLPWHNLEITVGKVPSMATVPRMKWMPALLTLTVAFAGGAAGGWWARAVLGTSVNFTTLHSSVADASEPTVLTGWMSQLQSISEEELSALVRAASAATTPLAELEAHLRLLRWAELAPEACLAWLAGEERWGEMDVVLHAWGLRAPAAAWQALRSMSWEQRDELGCVEKICEHWAEADPELFLSLPQLSWFDSPYAVERAIAKLARRDLAKTLQLVQSTFSEGWGVLAKACGQQNPALGCSWLADSHLIPKNERGSFQFALLHAWAQHDPAAAAAYLCTQPDLMRQQDNQDSDPRTPVLIGLAEKDLPQAVQWLKQNFSGGLQEDMMHSLAGGLKGKPEEWGAQLQAAIPDQAERSRLLESMYGSLPRNVTEADLRGLQGKEATADSTDWQLISNACAEDYVQMHSEEESLALLATLEEPVRGAMIRKLARRGLGLDDPGVVAYLSQHSEGMEPEDIASIFEYSTDAGQKILAHSTEPVQWSSAAESFAKQDPAAAQAWMRGVAQEMQTYAVRGLIRGWCETDEYAASTWVADQPPGPVRNQAAASLAKQLATADPAAAWAWITSVPHPEYTEGTLVDIVHAWKAADPAAATAAIQAARLPSELRQKLLETEQP